MPIWENKCDTQNKSYPEIPPNKILKRSYDLRSRGEKIYKNPGLQSSQLDRHLADVLFDTKMIQPLAFNQE